MRLALVLLLSAALAGCTGIWAGPIPECPVPPESSPMVSFSRGVDPARMLTVAAVGDVLLHDRLQKYAAGQADGFFVMMEPVADIIRAADVSFANLEGPAAAGISARGRKLKEPEC
jgi:hypothetical protein